MSSLAHILTVARSMNEILTCLTPTLTPAVSCA